MFWAWSESVVDGENGIENVTSLKVKLRRVELLMELLLKSYAASLAILDHTVLPVTWHKWTHPTIVSVQIIIDWGWCDAKVEKITTN